MKTTSIVEYPLPEKTIHDFTKLIFSAIKRGDCFTALFQPEFGKRKHSKFIINHLDLFKKELPTDFPTLAYYIDPADLHHSTPEAYLLLLLTSLEPDLQKLPDERILLQTLKRKVAKLVENHHLVFFLGKFDELTFMNHQLAQNLGAVWQIDKSRVHFVFLLRSSITKNHLMEKYGQLGESLVQNIYAIPPLTVEDIDYLIGLASARLSFNFSPAYKKIIAQLGHGNPHLIKIACEIIAKNPVNASTESLTSLVKSSPQYQFVLQLIRGETSELTIDSDLKTILLGDKPLSIHLSAREYRTLGYLLENRNKIISRDQIADVLWGKNSDEKYSDWAIDQMISVLRKKLQQAAIDSTLETIKGSGYRFTSKNN